MWEFLAALVGAVTKFLPGGIGRRRSRREALLSSLTELDAYTQSLVGVLVDAGVRGLQLKEEADRWNALATSAYTLGMDDSDRQVRDLAKRLRARSQASRGWCEIRALG